jgi:transmembrane sensor
MQVISGEISADDRAQFYEGIEDEGREEEFRAIMMSLYENQAALNDDDTAWETMIQTVLSHKTPVPKISWLKWSAAAAILIGISFTTYFLVQNKNNSKAKETIIAKTDIAPATNRAILYLANGMKIMLDSAQNGTLAKQGNTNIIKTDSGKLLYTSSASKTKDDITGLNTKNEFNTLTTPRGGIYQITLPDGTSAWLNAASSITYPTKFISKNREVKITGEVYFEVAHNAGHPFIVSFAESRVEVLGTHFNIKAYASNDNVPTKTTLLEGSIKISSGNESRLLKPGEQGVVAFSKPGIEVRRNADLEDVIAWRNGEMVLTNGTVTEVMNEISRWYDMDIEYAGAVPDKQFYGSIRRDVPLSTVLNALKAYGVETKLEGKKIIVQ